jgi:hypothetical protein
MQNTGGMRIKSRGKVFNPFNRGVIVFDKLERVALFNPGAERIRAKREWDQLHQI